MTRDRSGIYGLPVFDAGDMGWDAAKVRDVQERVGGQFAGFYPDDPPPALAELFMEIGLMHDPKAQPTRQTRGTDHLGKEKKTA